MSLKYTVIEIYSSEEARYKHKPLHEAIIDYVRGLKIAARCIVFRGAEGCYENGEVVTPKILELSYNMPLKVEVLLPSQERDQALHVLEEMVSEGVVATRELDLYSFKTRGSLLPRQIKVRDVMTPSPKKVMASTPIKEIIQLLSYSHFYSVPVVDQKGRPIGIITETDLITRANLPLRVGLLSGAEWAHIDPALESIAYKNAGDIMTQPVISIGADELVTNAVDRMLEKGLKRLPVVNETGELVGVLARFDVFRTITEASPNWRTIESQHVAVDNLRTVSDIMQRDTQTVSPDTSIEEVIRIIDAADIQRVAVTDEQGRYLGLITDRDLLAAFSEHHPGLWEQFASKLLFTQKGERHKLVGHELRSKTAAEVMLTDVPTVSEETGVDEAIRLMATKRLKRLPVVDANGFFKGMISRHALLRTGFRKS